MQIESESRDRAFVVASPEVRNRRPTGLAEVAAVVQQLVGRLVAIDLLVLPEGCQEVDERVGGDRELADRLGQGDEYRMVPSGPR